MEEVGAKVAVAEATEESRESREPTSLDTSERAASSTDSCIGHVA